MKKRHLLLLSAALVSPMSLVAATKTESVEKLLQVMQMEKQMSGRFEAMMPMINQVAAQLKLNPAQAKELEGIYRDWFEQDFDRKAILDKTVIAYEKAFTQEEVEAITAFYQTPAGMKMLEKSPELMKAGAKLGMQEAQARQPQLFQRLAPFMKKHGINP